MSHDEDEVVVEDDDLKVDVEELPEEKSVDGSLNASTDGEEDKVCCTKIFSNTVNPFFLSPLLLCRSSII